MYSLFAFKKFIYSYPLCFFFLAILVPAVPCSHSPANMNAVIEIKLEPLFFFFFVFCLFFFRECECMRLYGFAIIFYFLLDNTRFK